VLSTKENNALSFSDRRSTINEGVKVENEFNAPEVGDEHL